LPPDARQVAEQDGGIVLSNRIDIEDSDGNVLDTIHFRDVVTIID
jgi:hypothetical protein